MKNKSKFILGVFAIIYLGFIVYALTVSIKTFSNQINFADIIAISCLTVFIVSMGLYVVWSIIDSVIFIVKHIRKN